MEIKNCIVCGKPFERKRSKFCSKSCFDKARVKADSYLTKKCLFCGKPCHKSYCSKSCGAKAQKRPEKHFDNCLFCGNRFQFQPTYRKCGRLTRYCSMKCASSIYKVNDDFFTHYENIGEIYQILGFIYSCGFIRLKKGILKLISTIENLTEVARIISSNYPIIKYNFGNKEKKLYQTEIYSVKYMKYLESIGFNRTEINREFPTILEEYKLDFIKGYMRTKCKVYNKETYKLIILDVKSYNLAKVIADFTGSELITKHLSHKILIIDKNNTYI